MSTDFRVLQTYEELGQTCYEAIYDALLYDPDPAEPPPTKQEEEWAEGIARRARETFLRGLDAA